MRPEAARLEPTPGLAVEPGPNREDSVLLRFALKHPRPDAAGTGLVWLGGDLVEENWRVAGPVVQAGGAGELRCSRAGDLLFLAFEAEEDPGSDPAAAVEAAYGRLLDTAREFGSRQLLRAWNYLPAINAGAGDAERYRRFCAGRAAALERAGYGEGELCAGTAIGSDEARLRIYLLCASEAGVNIENPRQVAAYRYPRQYGPRSPSFARATAVPGLDGSVVLMVSGTASVVGHRTLHAGDVDAQLEELIRNLEILLAQSAERLARPGLAEFDASSLLRVYVRHAADWPATEARLRERWPEARLAGLRGDVCRSDLLVEIEAVSRS